MAPAGFSFCGFLERSYKGLFGMCFCCVFFFFGISVFVFKVWDGFWFIFFRSG